MMTDPIADMLTRIRNAYSAGKRVVNIPHSNMKGSIAELLKTNGYVDAVSKAKEGNHKSIKVSLKYINSKPAITNVERVSKPGRRVYVKSNNLRTPLSGYGLSIVSTSKGIMSAKKAREEKLGGELVCKVW
ncbi:30S ribosomal protein S8 [Patescibacteria group bacterium]